jgi:hypothetical protein
MFVGADAVRTNRENSDAECISAPRAPRHDHTMAVEAPSTIEPIVPPTIGPLRWQRRTCLARSR